MGLSLQHIQLTKIAVEPGDYILLDGWDDECNVPLNVYEEYITDVKTYSFDIEIAVFESDLDYEKYLKQHSNGEPEFEKVFIGRHDDSLLTKIESYIITKSYNSLERLELEIEANGIKHNTISFGEAKFEKGFYFQEECYQKHGMLNSFWDEFSKYSYYGLEEDFARAFEFLDTERAKEIGGLEGANRLVENFKMGFLGKYEFGRSLLAV